MDYFPVFTRLVNKPVLVIGGGEIACRKVELLLRAGADITLVSPRLHPTLQKLAIQQKIRWLAESYKSSILGDYYQVWATTDDRELNTRIFRDAQQKRIWVNAVDDPAHCDFITPSMIDRSPIQVAISSGGASPVLVRFLREKLETQLAQNLSLLAAYAGKQRERLKQHFHTIDQRRHFWEQFFRLPQVEHAQTEQVLETAFQSLLAEPAQNTGTLWLIETGTDTEMLTLKALRLMQQAEMVLYTNEETQAEFIDLCRRDADRAHCQLDALAEKAALLLQQSVRVCIFIEKGSTPESLVQLCTQQNSLVLPSL
ncbi:bifunctional precorrin-2 dehydrogenase/sirohydrochlorin ferrochelatase [Photobacterium galatheae]|uniref:precorrin-2 dehydrogenase n=1 Tax=Photobacterium galatheae TaxID=1654360 RepID=A0A066RQG2_9GAMM|nr:NAD(P)-dependent oxidoreductase [Photobacterium galatheae]KDM89932.1 ferrochelatase [Photobacterium galatheae]MCM0149769.1 siroheme synthase [Photobacterium galatheae]